MALALLQAAGQAQSLWRDDVSRAMVSDKRAANVGDILTIVVAETTTATKDNSTKTAKQSSWAASGSSSPASPNTKGLRRPLITAPT